MSGVELGLQTSAASIVPSGPNATEHPSASGSSGTSEVTPERRSQRWIVPPGSVKATRPSLVSARSGDAPELEAGRLPRSRPLATSQTCKVPSSAIEATF